MAVRTRFILLAVLVGLVAPAAPARAELVFFQSGRSLSVRAVRSDGDRLVLQLRGGGEFSCDRTFLTRVEPDEVLHEEENPVVLPITPLVVSSPQAASGPYGDLVRVSAARHGVDPQVVHAVIRVESGYDSRAVSSRGAQGLMQLLPSTGRQYGALDLLDPSVNIDAGVRHLKRLLARFDLPLALAAYNAGEGAVERFGGMPPFRETRQYVARVLHILGRI